MALSLGTWPSDLVARMPADEFSELLGLRAAGELIGLDRQDWQFAKLMSANAKKGTPSSEFFPYHDPMVAAAVDRVLSKGMPDGGDNQRPLHPDQS